MPPLPPIQPDGLPLPNEAPPLPNNTDALPQAHQPVTSGNTNLALAVFGCLWESLIVFAKDWQHV
jgi:hypothetical protein